MQLVGTIWAFIQFCGATYKMEVQEVMAYYLYADIRNWRVILPAPPSRLPAPPYFSKILILDILKR